MSEALYGIMPGSGVTGLQSNEIKLGEQLYSELSETGLNAMPVDDFTSLTLLDATLPEKPLINAKQATVKLLSQGGVALIRNEHILGSAYENAEQLERRGVDPDPQNYSFLDGLVFDSLRWDTTAEERARHPEFSKRSFAQRFCTLSQGKIVEITRIFTRRGDKGWTVSDFTDWGTSQQAEVYQQQLPDPKSVLVMPAEDREALGILYPAQRMYRRLENILLSLVSLQTGINSKTLIFDLEGNTDQASAELNRPDRNIAAISARGVSRVASTAQVDQLKTEFDLRLSLYLKTVHIVELEDKTHITEARTRLRLTPMLAFIETIRDRLEELFALAGQKITFRRIQVEAVAERAAQYTFLKQLRTDGVLSDNNEFNRQAQALAGV